MAGSPRTRTLASSMKVSSVTPPRRVSPAHATTQELPAPGNTCSSPPQGIDIYIYRYISDNLPVSWPIGVCGKPHPSHRTRTRRPERTNTNADGRKRNHNTPTHEAHKHAPARAGNQERQDQEASKPGHPAGKTAPCVFILGAPSHQNTILVLH